MEHTLLIELEVNYLEVTQLKKINGLNIRLMTTCLFKIFYLYCDDLINSVTIIKTNICQPGVRKVFSQIRKKDDIIKI